ncbi:MAG: hypothetical protein AB1664_22850 [Thermodesulfobacteriota bacterium]
MRQNRLPADEFLKIMSLVDRVLRRLKAKGIVEPVFGQIKQVRVIRAFLLRGLEKVKGE